jgi:hypothetical protein
MNEITIQTLGLVAVLFIFLSFQKNKRITLLVLMLVGLLIFTVYYILLHAYVGAIMNLIEASMVFVAYKKEDRKWAQYKIWPFLFIAIFIVAGTLNTKSWVDLLPITAQIMGTIAVWQTNPRAIRFIMLVPRPLWFAYNLTVGAYAGMLAEIIITISVVIGIIRFDIFKIKSKYD